MKTQNRWDIIVVGGANTDYLVRGPKLPKPGETIEGRVFQPAPGGKRANQAVAASRLGARVALVARVGDDERGHALIDQLKAESVDTRYVVRDKCQPTGVALIMVEENGEKQILTAPGANRHLTLADLHAASKAIVAARVTLLQFEVPIPVVTAAAHLARKSGARVILDPAPPVSLPNKKLLRLINVIRPNAGEAEALTGVRVRNRATARKAAQWLLERGVEVIAVQAGEEGNLLVWSGGEHWLPKIPVKTVDATGAGDAFAAALAVALAEGKSLPLAGAFANAAAALTTTKLGAQPALPRRDAVLALLSRVGHSRGKKAGF